LTQPAAGAPGSASVLTGAPGATISATAAFAAPSTVSWPARPGLIVRVVLLFTSVQVPVGTMSQSGSP
jgi:hypothetical protein